MKNFLIKFKDGTTKTISASITELSATVTEAALDGNLDYSKVEYAELVLHNEPIFAGDEGFYLLNAGRSGNRDFGIGYFKERKDIEFLQTECFIPVFALKLKELCHVAIVTGMPNSAIQVITVKDNQYTYAIRFLIDGYEPYETIKVEYHYINKKDATYSDMAKLYREYQLKHGFEPLNKRLTPETEYSVKSINVRIRMGWKPVPCQVFDQTLENEPEMHVACTFDDVVNVMESYHAAGIENIEFCLVGCNVKGHDGRWPQILPIEETLGGEEGLKRVMDCAKKYGYAVTCHTNSTDAYQIANNFRTEDLAIKRDGSFDIEESYWAGGTRYNVCPIKAYDNAMETLPPLAELGFRGMHYIDVITCSPARECYSKDHPINKREACKIFEKLFKDIKGIFGSVGCECAFDHSLRNCDFSLYVSFEDYTKGVSDYMCDKNVPFWQIIYHGIVASNPYSRTVNPTSSDNPDDLLKVIEYGGKPQGYYYAQFVSDGKNWIAKGDFHCNTPEEIAYSTECMKKAYDIYGEFAYLQYEFIENHSEIEPNVFETVYSDGSKTVVDYNTKTYTLSKKI